MLHRKTRGGIAACIISTCYQIRMGALSVHWGVSLKGSRTLMHKLHIKTQGFNLLLLFNRLQTQIYKHSAQSDPRRWLVAAATASGDSSWQFRQLSYAACSAFEPGTIVFHSAALAHLRSFLASRSRQAMFSRRSRCTWMASFTSWSSLS